MGERKGVNKYYPPDYDPSKGGLNKFLGTHALRERARKLHLGILIIRFEMPYNIWCDGCGNHIGTGVRYNAEKKKVGMYYTTPIYQFRMKCHLCDNHFEIQTDPANLDYVITSGARRQERRWDPSENDQVAPDDKAVGRRLAADAMFKLEHRSDDQSKASALDSVMKDLEDLQGSRWEDDFSANQALRQKFRASENAIKAQEIVDSKYRLSVPLLPPSAADAEQAALLSISKPKSLNESVEKRKLLDSASVFAALRPKTISRAAKKDVAKQSLANIVAASTQSFDTFKNDFGRDMKDLIKKKGKPLNGGVSCESASSGTSGRRSSNIQRISSVGDKCVHSKRSNWSTDPSILPCKVNSNENGCVISEPSVQNSPLNGVSNACSEVGDGQGHLGETGTHPETSNSTSKTTTDLIHESVIISAKVPCNNDENLSFGQNNIDNFPLISESTIQRIHESAPSKITLPEPVASSDRHVDGHQKEETSTTQLSNLVDYSGSESD